MATGAGVEAGIVGIAPVGTGRCRGSLGVSLGVADLSATGVDVELMELDERGCTVLRRLLLGVAAITGFGAIGVGVAGGLDLGAGLWTAFGMTLLDLRL